MAGRQKILNIDPDIEDSKDNNNFEFAKPLCGLHSSCLPRLAYRSSISDEPNFTLPTHNLPPSTSESIPNELRTAQTPSTGPAIDWKYALSNRNISHATHLHPFAHSRHPHGLGTGDILRRDMCRRFKEDGIEKEMCLLGQDSTDIQPGSPNYCCGRVCTRPRALWFRRSPFLCQRHLQSLRDLVTISGNPQASSSLEGGERDRGKTDCSRRTIAEELHKQMVSCASSIPRNSTPCLHVALQYQSSRGPIIAIGIIGRVRLSRT